jgi:pyrroloquinoline-quinone synthase
VRELIENFRRVAREGSVAEALAAFYAYESQVPRVAKEKARGLKDSYGADAKTRGYFTVHTYADVEHSRVWLELLNRELEKDPSQRDAALKSAESTAQWLWHALDGIEARRTAVAA